MLFGLIFGIKRVVYKRELTLLCVSLQEAKLAGSLVRLEIIIIVMGSVIGVMFLFTLVMVNRRVAEVKNDLKKIIELLGARDK